MKNGIPILIVMLVAMILLGLYHNISAYQDYSNTHVTNTTGAPMSIMDLTDPHGKIVAELYITGKEAKFNSHQRLVSGAGYIRAIKGKYIHIVFDIKHRNKGEKKINDSQIKLGVNRIDWDDTGKLTHISDIEPAIKVFSSNDLEIISDLQNPSLTDGMVNLDIKGQGKVSLKIIFDGQGTPVKNKIFEF